MQDSYTGRSNMPEVYFETEPSLEELRHALGHAFKISPSNVTVKKQEAVLGDSQTLLGMELITSFLGGDFPYAGKFTLISDSLTIPPREEFLREIAIHLGQPIMVRGGINASVNDAGTRYDRKGKKHSLRLREESIGPGETGLFVVRNFESGWRPTVESVTSPISQFKELTSKVDWILRNFIRDNPLATPKDIGYAIRDALASKVQLARLLKMYASEEEVRSYLAELASRIEHEKNL